ncbi:MAG TPA: hypothetical protein VM243_05240 [Phycisphaerae bacterium]|nr:hypothetical protein [Phycisphaerae bacterium]
MIRQRRLAGFLVFPGLVLVATGCQEWAGKDFWQQLGAKPVAAEPAPAEEPVQTADSDSDGVADPHQEETVGQVMDFIGRLDRRDASSEPGRDEAEEEEVLASSAPQPRTEASQVALTPRATARTNEPLDVTAAKESQPDVAEEPVAAPPDRPVIETVFIRSAGQVEATAPSADVSGAANNPRSTDAPMRTLTVEQMLEALRARVAEAPEDTAALWELRMLQLAVGDDQAVREVPASVSAEYAGLLGGLTEVLLAGRAALDNPVTASNAALEAVNDLRNVLRARSDLLIPVVALCTRVQTFGVYEELPADALLPHRPNRAIVYVEIRNFLSEESSNGQYRTVLSDELELLTASGQSVWRHEEPEIVDLCRRQREDFFLAQMVTLPATLGPGEYVLKVTVQDALSGKSNQAMLRFTLNSTSLAAAGR